MSNLTRETAFVPLLGSSNGLFLAITAVFFFFFHGARAQRGPKNNKLHVIFIPKAKIARQIHPEPSSSENLPILGAPMPLLTVNPAKHSRIARNGRITMRNELISFRSDRVSSS